MKTLMMIRKMKEVLTWVWIVVIGAAICLNVCAQTPQDWKGLEKQLNFYMANDLGRNGYYDQKPIAELMGEMADVIIPSVCLQLETCTTLKVYAALTIRFG